MTEQKSRELAGAAWCAEKTRNKVMDPELGLEFARILKRECDAVEESCFREAEAWKETARRHCRNEDYYRGLVVSIGKLFGKAAYTSDDGSVQQDVLCAKVPELVAAVMAVKDDSEAEPETTWRDRPASL